VDPLTQDAQLCDHDPHRTAIFYQDESQHRLAEESKRRLEESKRFDRPIVTEIAFYCWSCGRDRAPGRDLGDDLR